MIFNDKNKKLKLPTLAITSLFRVVLLNLMSPEGFHVVLVTLRSHEKARCARACFGCL